MYPYFDIDEISLDKLLRNWRWLVTGEFRLVAVSAFGDLFLEDVQGQVRYLDVAGGAVSMLAGSVSEFQQQVGDPGKRNAWFLENLAERAEQEGFRPGNGQCLGYKTPLVFKQSARTAENMYVADLYEYISFLGDLHEQIKEIPDGGQVRIRIEPPPERPVN